MLTAQDPPDGRSNVSWLERRGRHLVQERLEEVMVVTVEQRDPDRRARERLGCLQAAEPASNDDDARSYHTIDSSRTTGIQPMRATPIARSMEV